MFLLFLVGHAGGYILQYKFPDAQLLALQDVSYVAKQEVTFDCINVLFYNYGSTRYTQVSWFRPFGDAFLYNPATYDGTYDSRKPSTSLAEDDCRINDETRRSSDMLFEGDPKVRLSLEHHCAPLPENWVLEFDVNSSSRAFIFPS